MTTDLLPIEVTEEEDGVVYVFEDMVEVDYEIDEKEVI